MNSPYYKDDHVTIYHGDCFDILHELEGIGAVVTDPPYSSGSAYRGDRMQRTLEKYIDTDSRNQNKLQDFTGDNRDQKSFFAWCSLWMMACRNISNSGAVMCCFSDWRQLPTITDAIQAGGWVWRNIATWHKPGIRMQRGMFSGSAEYIVFATNGPRLDHAGCPQNVFVCKPDGEKEHIAQKPLNVLRWIMQVVPPESIVLDPFMGSGTTLQAAKELGFKSIGIDIIEKNCEISAERCGQSYMYTDK